ncbi:MAG: RBBP9/YdeN family alpha/beta hydrolase [Planctomycetota bacterium]
MTHSLDHVVLVPRWAGSGASDWYPALTSRGVTPTPPTFVPLLPEPGAPEIEPTVAALVSAIEAAPDPSRTLLIGHSVGCQTVLRATAELGGRVTVGGVLLVAAWWTVDDPWETVKPWCETSPDITSAARRTCPRPWRVLISDNDPYTTNHELNAAMWRKYFSGGADVRVLHDRKHFNAADEPDVFTAIRGLMSAPQ